MRLFRDIFLEIAYVVLAMEFRHLVFGGLTSHVDVEVAVDVVGVYEGMGHGDTFGFHRVVARVTVFADLGVVEVGDSLLASGGEGEGGAVGGLGFHRERFGLYE